MAEAGRPSLALVLPGGRLALFLLVRPTSRTKGPWGARAWPVENVSVNAVRPLGGRCKAQDGREES